MLQAVTWARQALAWLPPENRTWRNIALTVVGMGEILNGHLNNARAYLLEALLLNEQQGNLVYARATRGMLSWVSVEQGELHSAAEQFRQMQAEARAQGDSDDIARTQSGLAQIAYQWNDLQEARQAAQEVLSIGERMNVEEFQAAGRRDPLRRCGWPRGKRAPRPDLAHGRTERAGASEWRKSVSAVAGAHSGSPVRWSGVYAVGPLSSPAVVNGIVYVGSEDHNVYALVASTGVLHWRFLTLNAVDSSPALGHRACFRTCSSS